MFRFYLRKLAATLGVDGRAPAKKRRPRRSSLGLENLELRNLLAPLAWAPGANLPLAEAGIVAQPEGTGLLTLAGPSTTSYALSATYPSWRATTSPTHQPLDFARSSPGVGPLPNGNFLVFGGLENGFATSAVTQYDPNTVTVVDGVSNQTRLLQSMHVPRAEFGWATDANGLSYAIGGEDNNGTPLATMEVYNPSANSWSYLASLPQTLYGESAVSDAAGHIDVFGGVGANGTINNIVYRYTIATNTWDQTATPMQVGVRDAAAVLAPNGLIYVVGGQTASGPTSTVESYNISTNFWNSETSLPQPISSAAAAIDSLGRIEVLGGNDANGNPLATTYVSQELTQPDLAPAITSSPVTSGVLNGAFSYQVLTTGNPQPAYSLTAAPAGMAINQATGLINWTPTALGSYSVTVQASSSVGAASQTFSVNVHLPTPAAPTGLTGKALSTTSVGLSWNASADAYVTSYDVYLEHVTVYHSPKGSGGGRIVSWGLVASGITGTSATISGSGTYAVTAVNSEGMQSARSTPVSVAPWSPPDLYVATTLSGADISSLTLTVGQTGQIRLIAPANPAPTFSVVSGPSGVSVDATTGVVTYTPVVADLGQQAVVFAATNPAGTSKYTFYFDVVAINPTVTATGGTFTYDGNPHAAAATAVGTDGVTPVAGTFAITYNGNTTLPTAAGTYAIQAAFTSTDPTYANSVATGTLTINPATPNITISGGPFNYDGVTPQAATATAVGVDGVTPVAGSFQLTYNGGSNPPIGPGLFTVVAAFTSTDPNYASASVTANEIINSPGTQTPTLALVDGSTTFDGNSHADSATAVGTDGVTPVAGSFLITYSGSPTLPIAAGTYVVVGTFISSDPSYANGEIDGTMTISQATPTILFSSNTFIYNGGGQQAVVTALGVDQATPANGDVSVTYNGSTALPVDAGSYEIEVAFSSNDPNYLSTTAIGSLTILPATPSVGLGNGGQWQFTYDGMPQSVVGSAVGIDGLTPISGTFTYAYYNEYGSNTQLFGPPLPDAPTNAGAYTFIESFTSFDPNYTGGTFSWYLSIAPASATMSFNGGPFYYNGSPQSGIVSAIGVDGVTPVAGSVTYATYNDSTRVPSDAGTYTVVADFSSADPNYYSSAVSGTLVIEKATASFSNLSSPVVNVGTNTVTVSGHLSAGSTVPAGDDVAIILNGVTLPATLNGGGSFSATFNIQGLGTGSFPIVIEYQGDATHFTAATSGSGTLTVRAAPIVVANPASQTVVSGSSVTFTASATGYPAPTVQWQQSTNGSTYTSISGATSMSYTINAAAASQNGYRYRAVFANSVGSATTAAAILTVQYAPAVTANPKNIAVNAGQTAILTAAASGNPAPSVQWQVSTNGGGGFVNLVGATSATLTLFATTPSQNGNVYRAVFTNSLGSATTASAILTVRYAPSVTSNPVSQTVNVGQTAIFTASAAGNPTASVQWQVSTDGGLTFSNLSSATSNKLTVAGTTASQNSYQYRAMFTNNLGSVTTTAATLTVI